MPREVHVSLTDGMYRAAAARARHEERHTRANSGVASLIRHALRYYLTKNGYRAAELDVEGLGAGNGEKATGRAVPGTRKGSEA